MPRRRLAICLSQPPPLLVTPLELVAPVLVRVLVTVLVTVPLPVLVPVALPALVPVPLPLLVPVPLPLLVPVPLPLLVPVPPAVGSVALLPGDPLLPPSDPRLRVGALLPVDGVPIPTAREPALADGAPTLLTEGCRLEPVARPAIECVAVCFGVAAAWRVSAAVRRGRLTAGLVACVMRTARNFGGGRCGRGGVIARAALTPLGAAARRFGDLL